MVQTLQKRKNKEVSNLQTQLQMMKESLEQSKKKMQENAELMAVNSLFKRLKTNLDEIKVMVGDLNEAHTSRIKLQELQKEMDGKESRGKVIEERVRLGFLPEFEKERLSHE